MIRYTDCIQNKFFFKKQPVFKEKTLENYCLRALLTYYKRVWLLGSKTERNDWWLSHTTVTKYWCELNVECELITSVSWELVLYCSLHLQRQSWSSYSNGTHKFTPLLINHIKTTQSKDTSRPAAKPHCQMTGSATGWRKQSHSRIFVFVLSADKRTDKISL